VTDSRGADRGGIAADVPVRDAATVVLLRDGSDGLEVWLLTRVTQMAFAGGMVVFPGGRVDPADADLPFVQGGEERTATRLGCPPDEARALLGAAVRETFEETGVLLSVPTADLSGARTDVEAGRVSFGDLLRANQLSADADALHLWGRWVTPPGEVRRYDTRFFVAGLPDGADAQDVTTESSSAGWFGVGDALERAQRGEIGMLPPTMMTLASLAALSAVADVIGAADQRVLDAVTPTVGRDQSGRYFVELPAGTTLGVPDSLFPSD
jgi:8-oxo-dGTP pyrophosphatase MutT (NUDIX family)